MEGAPYLIGTANSVSSFHLGQTSLPGHSVDGRFVGLKHRVCISREVVEAPFVGPGGMALREEVQITKEGSREFAITQADDVHINGAGIVSAKGISAELQSVAGQ